MRSLGRLWIAGLLVATAPLMAATFDIAASRAYLKTAPSGGSEVAAPTTGQTVYFALDWQATGVGSASVPYRIRLDGTVVFSASIAVASVPRSSTTVYPQAWTATSGNHTIAWELDYANTVAEMDETNNTATVAFTVAQLDILTSRAYLKTSPTGTEAASPTPGQTVYFALDWYTTGTGSPVSVSYRAMLDGSTFCAGSTSATPLPGSATVICSQGWTATAGGHSVTWTLDYTNAIKETYETNNTTTLAFTVSTPGAAPTFDIVAKFASVRSPYSGGVVPAPTVNQYVLLMADFQVTGTGSFGGLPYRVTIDGVPVYSWTIPSVYRPPADGLAAGISWYATPGTHKFQIEFNYDHSVPETDASNNTVSAEFSVSSPGGATNLALGRTATQSSTYSSTTPSAAVDGSTDGVFADTSVTSTNQEANPWWQVDLGYSRPIGSIVLWNRTDCCASRLKDYWLFVSDTPFLPADTPATLQNRAGTFASHQTATPDPSVKIPVDTTGRYVRVQLTGSDYLSLAEVQVFGQIGVTVTHVGNFMQGQPVARYTVTVQNARSTATTGDVLVYDAMDSTGVPTAAGGPGWSCTIDQYTMCSRSDPLPPGGSYPPITVTASIAANASSQLFHIADVAVGGAYTAYAYENFSVQPPFTDVSASNLFLPAIDLLKQYSITSACQDQPLKYCPDDNISEAQMAVFVVRSVMGGDNFTYTKTPYFTDVPADNLYFPWIQKMQDLGIAVPCAANRFCPDTPVTRGIMAVLIVRARYGTATPASFPSAAYFTDVPSSHPFFSWIQKMKQLGITSGCSDTTYCPEDPVTRGQMAVFIMRGGFNLLLPATTPSIAWASAPGCSLSKTVTVTIAGQNTNFVNGITQVNAGPGITVSNISVVDGATLTAQFTVSGGAAPGPRSITVTTGAEEATLPNGFRVQ